MSTVTRARMTVEEFLKRYGDCSGVELIRGQVVWSGQHEAQSEGVEMPNFEHGVIGNRASFFLTQFVLAHDLGWVAGNDTFVPLGDDIGSVLGPDVLFISYTKVPKGKPPKNLTVAPDLVVEVRSPSDRWGDIFGKVSDYLNAGVTAVLVLDPQGLTASVYRQDGDQKVFRQEDELTFPDILPGFAVPVRTFFE